MKMTCSSNRRWAPELLTFMNHKRQSVFGDESN